MALISSSVSNLLPSGPSTSLYVLFWIFGLTNNILYVVILSAAIDIVGPNVPKSVVLLVDILPSLLFKLASPFFIHKIQYNYRIVSLIILSVVGMVLVSSNIVGVCLCGVVLASLSSGFGEVTFLQLTHMYKEIALNGWSSGTGGAGLLGSGIYMFLTTVLGVSVRMSLLFFSLLPFSFLLYYRLDTASSYTSLDSDITTTHLNVENHSELMAGVPSGLSNKAITMKSVRGTLKNVQRLILPYMLPLTTVYFFEYLINQAVTPTLLFPIEQPASVKRHLFEFKNYRDYYVTYGTLYQVGVFISRSTASMFRIKHLYLLSLLQGINFLLTIVQSCKYVIHRPFPIMMLILYEGLLGGSSYVNTFLNVLEDLPPDQTEAALGTVTIADSLGVLFAALVGITLEPALCGYQINHGRDWCIRE